MTVDLRCCTKLLPAIALPLVILGVCSSPALAATPHFLPQVTSVSPAGPVAVVRFVEAGFAARGRTVITAQTQLKVTSTCLVGSRVTAISSGSGAAVSARTFAVGATGRASGSWRVQLPVVRVSVDPQGCTAVTTTRALVVVLRDVRTGASITLLPAHRAPAGTSPAR